MIRDLIYQGLQWVKENCTKELKSVVDEQCEISIPMSKGQNADSLRDVEEHVKNGLQKKREITSVWFENNEEKEI